MNDIDERPLARRTDPATSHQAAAGAAQFAHAHEDKILAALRAGGPMGKTRLAAATRLDDVAVARRMAGMRARGLVEPTGGTEASGSGRAEGVWRAVGS